MTTIVGLIAGFALVIFAMTADGNLTAFVDIAAIAIVLGGTAAVTAVSFTLEELRSAPTTLYRILFHAKADAGDAARTVLRLAERARRDGILDMERFTKTLSRDPFLHKAMGLVVDGMEGDQTEKILKRETFALSTVQMNTINILRRAAEVSPAMGLIGTLVGLVKMLGTLDDPSTIGPAMAIALLTTFYGAMLAHMVFLPLASRAERNAREEALLNSIYTTGAASIGRKENPRQLEVIINTILPPAKRIQYFT
ncbi:MAG: MotA/TolQ/ExbB proton channel family protein [Sphingomonadales bacterium]